MIFNKRYFEKVFEKSGGWGYAVSEYEKTKYQRQIEAIRECCPNPRNILEVGCAEGLHTAMLAQTFPEARIMCVDISHSAIEKARKACQCYGNVEMVEADIVELFKKLPENAFDVIVQSECLYYLFPRFLLQRKLFSYFHELTGTLNQDGIFVTANGMNLITGFVMGTYYLIIKRFCVPVFSASHREWNEFRKKNITYDLKVFKLKR